LSAKISGHEALRGKIGEASARVDNRSTPTEIMFIILCNANIRPAWEDGQLISEVMMEDICSYYGTVCIYKHGTFLTSCLSIAAEYRVSAGSPSNPCNTRLEINYLFLVLLNAS